MSESPTVLDRLFPDRGLDSAVAEAHAIVAEARSEHGPIFKTVLLFSGGKDSTVLLDALAEHADVVLHVNTGIGIPEAHEHARQVAERYDIPYAERHPPTAYEELVYGQWEGLPGPGAHRFTYTMLKERVIEAFLAEQRSKRGDRFLLLAGIRRAESKRRSKRPAVYRKGGQVWANPLTHWKNEEMAAYRTAHALPVSEVAANLHMSGECLCGAMADQGGDREERATIRFFYPEFDARLTAIEAECQRRGLRYCEWGVKREGAEDDDGGELCQSCAYRQERFAWAGADATSREPTPAGSPDQGRGAVRPDRWRRSDVDE